MLLANVSDKNVGSIVEKVANGNIMRYIKVMGIEDGNVTVYGKKSNKEDKSLYIYLNESLIEAADLWQHNAWYYIAMQKINDKAKELGIKKVIDIRSDNNFSENKGLDYTIGLPAVLRVNHPDFCGNIIEMIIGSLYDLFDFNVEETPNAHAATSKFTLGTFRPDIPTTEQDMGFPGNRPWMLDVRAPEAVAANDDGEEDEEDENEEDEETEDEETEDAFFDGDETGR